MQLLRAVPLEELHAYATREAEEALHESEAKAQRAVIRKVHALVLLPRPLTNQIVTEQATRKIAKHRKQAEYDKRNTTIVMLNVAPVNADRGIDQLVVFIANDLALGESVIFVTVHADVD